MTVAPPAPDRPARTTTTTDDDDDRGDHGAC